jgi:shikimate dehydrogenase
MKTEVFGLIGNPVKHSLSPLMHNAAFKYLKIDAEYRLFEVPVEKLEGVLLGTDSSLDTEGKVSSKDLNGFNVTIPYKVEARQILEKKFPHSKGSHQDLDLYYVELSGAVNTVKREDDRVKYYNTDAGGFFMSLWEDLKFVPKNKNVLVIGCGGAGRAIIAALSWINVKTKNIYVADVNETAINSANDHFKGLKQYGNFKNKLKFISNKDVERYIKECQLLVNATPVGMHDADGSVVNKNSLHENLSIYDIVYRKGNVETQLIKDAKSLKLNCANGLGMLLYQGAIAFNKWTGETPPIKEMRQALQEGAKKIC